MVYVSRLSYQYFTGENVKLKARAFLLIWKLQTGVHSLGDELHDTYYNKFHYTYWDLTESTINQRKKPENNNIGRFIKLKIIIWFLKTMNEIQTKCSFKFFSLKFFRKSVLYFLKITNFLKLKTARRIRNKSFHT